jgi:stage II sporulation protein AA (anti-sigma F factor antagonist)
MERMELERAQARILAEETLRAIEENPEALPILGTGAGDPRRLRGLPLMTRGVRGVMPDTQPGVGKSLDRLEKHFAAAGTINAYASTYLTEPTRLADLASGVGVGGRMSDQSDVEEARRPRVECEQNGADVTVVRLLGEHDLASADEVARQLRSVIRAGKRVVVDVTQTAFLDSSILNQLIVADRALKEGGRRLVLQFAAEPISRIFEVSGLRDMLPHAASREDAIRLARESVYSARDGS